MFCLVLVGIIFRYICNLEENGGFVLMFYFIISYYKYVKIEES